MGSAQSAAGLPSPSRLTGEDVLFVSVMLLIPIKRRAGAWVALDLCVLRAFFNRRRSAAAFDNGRSRRSVVHPPLVSQGWGPDRSTPTAGK